MTATITKPIYILRTYSGLAGASSLEKEIYDRINGLNGSVVTYDRLKAIKRMIMDIQDRFFYENPRCKKDRNCKYDIIDSGYCLTICLGDRNDCARLSAEPVAEILDYDDGLNREIRLPKLEKH